MSATLTTLAKDPTTGQLCVRAEYRESDRPVVRVLYWPVLRTQGWTPCWYRPHTFEQFNGSAERCLNCEQHEDTAIHAERWRQVWGGSDGGKYGGAVNGQQYSVWIDPRAQAITVEEQPVPCPKVRKGIEVRYHREQWQKYSRAKGWITI